MFLTPVTAKDGFTTIGGLHKTLEFIVPKWKYSFTTLYFIDSTLTKKRKYKPSDSKNKIKKVNKRKQVCDQGWGINYIHTVHKTSILIIFQVHVQLARFHWGTVWCLGQMTHRPSRPWDHELTLRQLYSSLAEINRLSKVNMGSAIQTMTHVYDCAVLLFEALLLFLRWWLNDWSRTVPECCSCLLLLTVIGLLTAHKILLNKQAVTNAAHPSLHRQGKEVEVEADSVNDRREG